MSRYENKEYEDWDEYEDEEQDEERIGEDEYEEEEEEKAPPQPSQQELEYLELRKQLKERLRKQLKKENGSSRGQTQVRKKLPYDNFGSFFGPSQPVIAQRVIQESKSLLENERLTAKVAKPHHRSNNSASTSNGGSNNHIRDNRPKVVNELKHKVRDLKVARDYSFLLSDDAELPAPRKDPPRNVPRGSISDARSAQMSPKNKQSFNSNGRQIQKGGSRQLPSSSRQVPNGSRQLSNGRDDNKKVSGTSHKLNSASKPISKPVDPRKQLANNGSGPGRPLVSKPNPSKMASGTLQKKVPSAGGKSSLHNVTKPPFAKLQSTSLKQPVSKQTSAQKQPLVQRKEYQDSTRAKILSKHPVASSKPQIGKPSAKVPTRPTSLDNRPKKRPARPYSDDEDDLGGASGVSSMIQKLMGYNPNKYKDRDLDDSDMEVNFDEILKEEKRSEIIARREDEEELRKIEEEERREKLRAKKRKLGHR